MILRVIDSVTGSWACVSWEKSGINIDYYLDLRSKKGISDLFFVVGSFGVIDGVDDSFSKEFLKGGPVGFSSNLCDMPDRYKDFWREKRGECVFQVSNCRKFGGYQIRNGD